jgi:hypothetical protein
MRALTWALGDGWAVQVPSQYDMLVLTFAVPDEPWARVCAVRDVLVEVEAEEGRDMGDLFAKGEGEGHQQAQGTCSVLSGDAPERHGPGMMFWTPF